VFTNQSKIQGLIEIGRSVLLS